MTTRIPIGSSPARLALLLGLAALSGCDGSDSASRGSEWVESSHGNVDPDSASAFPSTLRRELVVSISDTAWDAMLAALSTACASGCTGSSLDDHDDVTAWHEADLVADGQTWKHVGLRLRSNSQLADAWTAGNRRFPFRLTMDKLEDAWPSIEDQRFYGYQKLALDNLADDSTLLRHQAASAAYRSLGVPALLSTLVDLRLAHGTDTLDLGTYSLRESPDQPFLERSFGKSSGAWFEPSSDFVSYLASDFEEGDNNDDQSPVLSLFLALQSSSRTSDPASWRAGLSGILDMDGFLQWLAVSTALGDHGSYGYEAGNYGLYARRDTLRWAALDLDETFPSGNGAVRGVWHAGAVSEWPLIGLVLSDSVYCEDYKARLLALVADGGTLSAANLAAEVESAAVLVSDRSDAASLKAGLLAFAASRPAVVDTSVAAHACPWKE